MRKVMLPPSPPSAPLKDADFLKKIKNLSSNTEEKNVKPTEKEVVVTDENTGKNTNKSYGCTHWH